MPLLFLAWANLHGGFTAGLFVLGLILVSAAAVRVLVDRLPHLAVRLQEPALAWPGVVHVALVLLLAALVTLINPYGWRLHAEIVKSLTDRFMIETLHEWQPVSLSTKAGTVYVGYLCVLAVLMLGMYRRIEPVRWVLLSIFLFLSLKHWRNVPFFLLVSAPVAADVLGELRGLAARLGTTPHVRYAGFVAALALAGSMVLLGPDHLQRVAQAGLAPAAFFHETDYPIEAVGWIKTHRERLGSRLYNDYGDGGFLLWWLPGEKIFIDGRMPAWRIGEHWIFYDYAALALWDPPKVRVLDKYNVDWAIVGRNSLLDEALEQNPGWKEAYSDKKVTIYVSR